MGTVGARPQLIVCLGPGGVGKTSVSAALSLSLAKKQRTLIITIDPSKRLATALGFQQDGNNEIVVEGTAGQLTAKLSEPKAVFSEYLRDQLEDSSLLEKLGKNQLFRQLTTSLGGSQEFSSIYQIVNSFKGEYDTIILDTPPATNAMDFFTAPQKLYRLFDDSIFSWFLPDASKNASLFKRVFNKGTLAVFKALELITGEEFIKELREFFLIVSKLRGNIFEISKRGEEILHSSSTQYFLVTSADEVKIAEAKEIQMSMKQAGLRLHRAFINRARPLWLDEPVGQLTSKKVQDYHQQLSQVYSEKATQSQKLCEEMRLAQGVVLLPDLGSDISGLDGLNKLSLYMEKESV